MPYLCGLWRFANAYLYRKNVRGNQYGRKEELYECEDCSGCPYAEKCKKTDKNRTVRINQELTSMHQEVIENLVKRKLNKWTHIHFYGILFP